MKPKRIRKKKAQFNVRVDAELLKRANKARSESWVLLVESMLHWIILNMEKGKKFYP